MNRELATYNSGRADEDVHPISTCDPLARRAPGEVDPVLIVACCIRRRNDPRARFDARDGNRDKIHFDCRRLSGVELDNTVDRYVRRDKRERLLSRFPAAIIFREIYLETAHFWDRNVSDLRLGGESSDDNKGKRYS